VSSQPLAGGIRFYCTSDYNPVQCAHDVKSLEEELTKYPLDRLGRWSFVLTPSDHWPALVAKLKGNTFSPAFSVLGQKTTVFEQAIFSPAPVRAQELMEMFGTLGGPLLRLAVTHELGHALCSETDERRADEYGRELRSGQTPLCPALAAEDATAGARASGP
jgi:hypothetical protein